MSVWLWCARIVWAALPVAAGTAFADAIDGWSTGPARLAAVLLWVAWAAGLLALFAPRPWGMTLLRIVAPLGVVATVASITSTTSGSATLAVSTMFIAAVTALSAPVTFAAANALAYGDEVRFPVRIPTPLLLGPVPIAIAIAGATLVGPFLLADANLLWGTVLTLVGIPIAFLVVRSLHSLARRWLVLVPAGIAFVDPLTLTDPVLVPRAAVANIHTISGTALPAGVLDLRLGTVAGGLEVELAGTVTFGRRRGRADGQLVEPESVVIAVVQPRSLLSRAGGRGLATR